MDRVEARIPRDDIVLLPGSEVQEQLGGGLAQTYTIPVAAGQFLRVVVEQRGILIMATLFDPSGKELIKTDNPSGPYGPIYLSAISQSKGDYRLEVRSSEVWANAGRFKISIDHLRDATEADRAALNAEKNYAEGRQLFEDFTVPAERKAKLKRALDRFKSALSYWEGVRDRHWLALIHYCLAATHRSLDDLPTAATHFEKSLEVQVDEQLDWRLRATVFNDRGATLGRLGDEQKALESFNEAFKIYENHRDRRGQASVFNNIGFQHLNAGRYREAGDILKKALPLRRAENDRASEATLLNNIAGTLGQIGETRAALQGYQEALQIWEELNRQGILNNALSRLATGFNNVALAYDRLGEWQQAFENYEKALALYGPNPPVVAARTLDNMGELYAVLGDSGRAFEYYEKAQKLSEGKDARAEANVLNHIGELYLSRNDLTAALRSFERTLALRKDNPGRANALTNIGSVYILQGNPRKALESYESALNLIGGGEDPRSLAFTLQRVGEAQALLNDPGKALDALHRALPLWRAVADQRGEAATLFTIARVERDRGKLAEALERSKQSISIIESLRTKVVSQRLRSSFFASQQSHYDLYIDLRMRLYRSDKSTEHLTAAFAASEQSRARSLVDTLTEAQANLDTGVTKELIDQEREAQQKLNDKARIQMELLNSKHSKEQAANIEKEVNQAVAEYDAVKARIKSSSPAYAQLTQPQALSLGEIQKLLVDDETLLLEYFLGEEKSYLWLVSRSSIIGVDSLPKRSEIESRARAVYDALTKLSSSLNDIKTRGVRTKNRAASVSPDPVALSQILLGPIADKIGKKRLLIVGDGVLHYLPFGALPLPVPASSKLPRVVPTARAQFLIQEHEIVYLPSASVLSIVRSEANRKAGALSVAVIANPVFTSDDERLKTAKQKAAQTSAPKDLTSNFISDGRPRSGLDLVPLPATEREALAIRDAVGKQARIKISEDFEASRATVMKLQGEGYRIIHFATHGDLNTEHPELSSIVLSLFDSEGRSQEGFLRLHDIYNLKLPADLIVLSACSTGLGQIIRGEGLIGLTRGFMYAGSPRVVASLWRVEDLGTSELMSRFYQHMARDGMAPPSALRQAQIEMLRSKRWKSPYFWAGFVLQGEWSAIRWTH